MNFIFLSGAVCIVVAVLMQADLGSVTWMLIISPVFSGVVIFFRAKKRLGMGNWNNSGSSPNR